MNSEDSRLLNTENLAKISLAIFACYYAYPAVSFTVSYGPFLILAYQAWKKSYDLRQSITLLKTGYDWGKRIYKKYYGR